MLTSLFKEFINALNTEMIPLVIIQEQTLSQLAILNTEQKKICSVRRHNTNYIEKPLSIIYRKIF